MKRLLLLYQWQGGGIPEVFHQLAKVGLFKGYQVTLCVAEPIAAVNRDRFIGFSELIDMRRGLLAFLPELRRSLSQADMVHVNSFIMLFLHFLLGEWRVPTVFQIHNEYDYIKRNTLKGKFKYRLLWLATKLLNVRALISVSAYISEMLNGLEIPITVIENGIVAQKPSVEVSIHKVPIVLGIGRLDPEKQFDIFVDIAQQINQQLQIEFHIYGQGVMRQQLQNRIDVAGLQEIVQLKGYTQDPLAAMASANILLCTSSREGGPLTFAEALSVGLPIVTFPVGVARYLFEQEPAVKVGEEISQLASYIVELVSESDKARHERKKQCIALFHKHFNVVEKVTKYRELYDHLCS